MHSATCRVRGRRPLRFLLAAIIGLGPATSAGAIIVNHLTYGLHYSAQDAGFPGDGDIQAPPPITTSSPLNDSILRNAQSGTCEASCTVLYSVRPGHVSLLVSGSANSPNGSGFAFSRCQTAVGSRELVTLDTPSLPPGATVRVHALHFLIGTSVRTDVVADFPDQARAEASLSFPAHQYQSTGPDGYVSAPFAFNVTLLVQVGQAALYSLDLESAGLATASFGSASYAAVANGSLHWGGIDWVENVETGQPITDWTISSESGTDYSEPVEIPEPSGTACLGSGVAALAGLGTLRRRRSNDCGRDAGAMATRTGG